MRPGRVAVLLGLLRDLVAGDEAVLRLVLSHEPAERGESRLAVEPSGHGFADFTDYLAAGARQAMAPRNGVIPSTPRSMRSRRPTIGASAVTSVISPKSVTHMLVPSKQQFSGT